MGTILIVSQVLLWLVALFNLLLTFALIRRINAASAARHKLPDMLSIGQTAPAFAARTLAGDQVTHADYADRATVLLFISPGCASCHKLLPTFHLLEPRARQSGIDLILVSDGDLENTRTMADERNIRLPLLVAPSKETSFFRDYKIHGTPSYCFIDEQGIVQSVGHPYENVQEWKALTDSWTDQPIPPRKEGVPEHTENFSR